MLPGRTFTPEEIVRIARRRIWFLLLPLAVIAAGTAVWVRTMPDRYRSETVILVVPQAVPESYVRTQVATKLEDRLQSIQQQILSRTKLEHIITEFNLYPEERRKGLMEDVVGHMRTYDIGMQVVRGDAFRISYDGENARTVSMVAERLGSLFINESEIDRNKNVEGTSSFVEAQLIDAKQRLVEQEKKLEAYKLSHAGQLPSQLESNLQVLQNAQSQLQNVMQTLNRERDNQTRLERDIADLDRQIEDSSGAGPLVAGVEGDTPAKQLAELKEALEALLLTRRDTHPDVKRMRTAIADLEAKVNAAPATTPDTPVSTDLRRLSPADAARRKRLEDMKLELARSKRNVEMGEREQARLKNNINVYEQRNEGIPIRETEMTELLRDYSTLNATYLSLLSKKEDSKMALSVQTRQIGEQFKVIDPARVSERPVNPNRPRLNAMGMFAGIAVGLLLIALFEYRDNSFKTDHDITRVLSLPVLAVVPFMKSAAEEKRTFRYQLLMACGFSATVLACTLVVVYTFVR